MALLGPLAPNSALTDGAEVRFEHVLLGPESFEVDYKGRIYTGTADGKIVQLSRDASVITKEMRIGRQTSAPCSESIGRHTVNTRISPPTRISPTPLEFVSHCCSEVKQNSVEDPHH